MASALTASASWRTVLPLYSNKRLRPLSQMTPTLSFGLMVGDMVDDLGLAVSVMTLDMVAGDVGNAGDAESCGVPSFIA